MDIREALSKESIANRIKSLGKLRIRISHGSIMTISALLLILFVAFTIRILPLRWEIAPEKNTLLLSEFDPYYQYSLAKYMVENGLFAPYIPPGWVDYQRWYPDGINMSQSYPSLPMTAAFFYKIISMLGVNIDLMSFCALFPAIMGTLACLIIYFVGKDIGGTPIGLFSALFLALSPSYIQRTSLGFFDDETIGIVALLLFMYMFLKSLEEDRPLNSTMKYAIGSGLALGYFISGWGAAFYPIGLTTLFVLVLILIKRYSQRLLLSYTVTFGLGLFIAINVPYLSLSYLTASAIIPVAAVFVLLCVAEILHNITSTGMRATFAIIFICALIGGFAFLWQYGYLGSIAGKFISVINPFARAESPLVESVAEHRISAWGSIYYEFGIGIIFFIAGLYFLIRKPTNKNLFIILFGITSLYFACSMVRLLVLMAPAFSLVATSGVLGVLRPFYTLLKEPPKPVVKKKYGLEHVGKEFSGTAIFLIFLILMTNFAFSPQSGGVPKVYRQAYTPTTISAGSLPIAPNQPVKEWLDMLSWLRSNLGPKPIGEKVVCSWWDYGYWLSILGNVTSLADNATINYTQIENIGFIFMANETDALKMLKLYDAKYILVFTTFYSVSGGTNLPAGTWAGYGDEGKWMWMARISGKVEGRFKIGDTNGDGITDVSGLIDANSTWVDESKFGQYDNTTNRWAWNVFGMQSTIYKLMAWGKHQWCELRLGYNQDPEINTWTANNLTIEDIQPKYFEIAYIAGLDLTQVKSQAYGYIVPLVCLYKINWEKYYADYPNA